MILLPMALPASAQPSEEATGLYEITTEIGMPHLEEALRYTITHQKRCLTRDELHQLFPILSHPALTGCHLGAASRQADSVSYPLVCEGHHGTTGAARWQSGDHRLTGTLDVKLGGKNMTFYQRITAIVLGGCP
jgi:hypothetical protein